MKGLFLGLANGTTCLAVCAPVLVPFLMHEGASIRQNLGTLLKFLGGRLGGYVLFGLLAWAMGSLLVLGARYQLLLTGVTYVGLALLLLLGVLPTLPADDLCGDGRVGKLPTLLATTSIGGQSWQKLRKRVPRAAPCALEQARATFGRWPAVLPAGMGFLAAINICPPLLLAFTDAASTGTLFGSLLLFLTFCQFCPPMIYVGTAELANCQFCPPMIYVGTAELANFLGTSIYFIPLSLLGAFRRVGDLRIVGQFAAVLVALYYLVLGISYCAGGVR